VGWIMVHVGHFDIQHSAFCITNVEGAVIFLALFFQVNCSFILQVVCPEFMLLIIFLKFQLNFYV